MAKIPRDYQYAAATALWDQVHKPEILNPLVVMPTGTGKSLTMALFIHGMMMTYPHLRMLNLTHVKELVKGNYLALKDLWPTAPAGVYSAGLNKRDLHGQVTFAGIDSFKSAVKKFGHVDFVIVDEAHRVSDNDKSSYQKVFAHLRSINPNLIVIGFTATDYRMGMGKLTDGDFFDVVCFDLSDGPAFVWMIDQKYLVRLVPRNPGFQVDESKVKIKAGDYDERSASQAFRDQDILERAVDTTIEQGQDRQSWLTFAQSIEDADLIADMFRYKGYPVESVHSKRGDRDEVLAAFERGELRGVVNQGMLTTGYDNARIDLIVMLRLCRSPSLWVQMLGRGTRPLWTPGYDLTTLEGRSNSILASAKQNCLVLDFAGNTSRLGPINYPTLPKKKGAGGGTPPVRECPNCRTYVHISIKCCPECGYEFPVITKLKDSADTQELVVDLNNLPPPVPKEYAVFPITQMIAAVHPGKGNKPATMRVDYFSSIQRFSTWVCPAHSGYALEVARDWWFNHSKAGGGIPTQIPSTADEAVIRFPECGKPMHIKVWINTKYPEIVGYDFTGDRFELPEIFGGPSKAQITLELEAARQAAAEDERQQRLKREILDDDIPF